MKLQIKTLNQKCLVIDMEETKTVYELKKELSLYPDIGVKPELQKLIYAGKVLANEDTLGSYNIDVKKFLVIMILKPPLGEPPIAKQQPQQGKVMEDTAKEKLKEKDDKDKDSAASATSSATKTGNTEIKTPPAPANNKKDDLVKQIVSMGYPESDVRRALTASFYNPERAIEYLIEGIPTTPSTPEGESFSDTVANLSMTPFEVFHSDPEFQRLRNALYQHPDLLDTAIQRIGESNPALLNLISQNQQDFLGMMIDESDEEYEVEVDTEDEDE